MSEISEERLALMEQDGIDDELPYVTELVAEIRRLRAENAELRDSYERVDRARRELEKPFTSGRGFA